MTTLRKLALTLFLLAVCVPVAYPQAAFSNNIRTINPTFTTIDVPGAGYTGALAINKNGDIVGDYGQDTNSGAHGFLYSAGVFTYFDYPGSTVTVPLGINDSGLIAGYTGMNPVYGFLFDGATFINLQNGTNSATFASGINNAGAVVGGSGTIYSTKGFEMRNSQYKTINFPGTYIYAQAEAINNLGEIAGYEVNGIYEYGYSLIGGRFRQIAISGATQTLALGINDGGAIVGWYSQSGACNANNCAFVLVNGRYASFSYPGAAGTTAYGINASGQVVGSYTFDFNTYHGFVTSPITASDFQ